MRAFIDFWTAREPGCGFFGGAEGALRFLVLFIGLPTAASLGYAFALLLS